MKSARIIYVLAVLLMVFGYAPHVHAGILQQEYDLTSAFSNSLNLTTGFVTIDGVVTATAGQQPASAILNWKSVQAGTTNVVTWPVFSPAADGSFHQVLSNTSAFQCGQVYEFRLFEVEFPNTSGQTETPIEYSVPGQSGTTAPGFAHQISCGQAQSGQGDIMTPQSAQAEAVAGVNWGTIVSTDTSISFNGAHLIPFNANSGPITFQIEYGYGQAGQVNSQYVYIGDSQNLTTSGPNFNFNMTLSGLVPNTEYYFTVVEIVDGVETNTFTYGFAPTNLLTGDVSRMFESGTTNLKIYGHLETQNNQVLYNQPIRISLRDMGGTELLAADVVTGPPGNIGAGYFEHTFYSLTGLPAFVQGQQYQYVILNNDSIPETGIEMMTPGTFTVPNLNTSGGGGTATVTIDEPPYSGLVTCGLDPDNYDCDFNMFLALINRVANFLLVYIAFPFIGIVVAYAGFLLITSGGSESKLKEAKGMIWNVVIGLVVALLAWVIIKLVLSVFGYQGPLWQILGTQATVF